MQTREQLFQQWTDEGGEEYAKWMMEAYPDVERWEAELDELDNQERLRRPHQVIEKQTIVHNHFHLFPTDPWSLILIVVSVIVIIYVIWH